MLRSDFQVLHYEFFKVSQDCTSDYRDLCAVVCMVLLLGHFSLIL